MSHEVETMAYVRQTPWHGLGERLAERQPLEVWSQAAGMDWTIKATPVRYLAATTRQGWEHEQVNRFEGQQVLYRSDTGTALSVVSERYKIVQPADVLEFYRDLSEVAGYELETAGVLKGGRKFWALARTGKETAIKGNDLVKGYLLLATSCDGSLATTATPTTVRVVCNNTLSMALANSGPAAIRVPHSRHFDADAVKSQLGVAVTQWDGFMYRMKMLAERKVKTHEAMDYYLKVFAPAAGLEAQPNLPNERAMKKAMDMYEGQGRGAEVQAAKGTAWGLLSSITEFVDHERRARNRDYRLDSAWFGPGAALKQKALDQALALLE